MIPYHGQRYFATTETVNDVLKQYGVAIIPSLLSSKECDKMLSDMWNYLETVTASFERPINRDDTQTWREFKKLFPLHSMLVQHWQIGHSKLVWRLRQNPKIYNVFAAIYDVEPEELLVSFDGASFHFPPEITGVGFRQKENSGWLHCDQSYLRNRRECVQAWVTANDVEKDDATLVFLEGSHKFHQKFAATFPPRDKEYNQDWYRLSERQVEWYIEQGCTPVCIRCPKGSLVLWDSRVIHAGTESKRNRANPKIRCVAYICFMPRGDTSETMLKKKRKAFEEMRTTNHWPCKPRLFPKTPRTYGAPLPAIEKIEMPEVGELGLKFAGF
jgi:hypothetical protein